MDTKKCISSPIVHQETRDTPDILHRTRINSINFLLLMGPQPYLFHLVLLSKKADLRKDTSK